MSSTLIPAKGSVDSSTVVAKHRRMHCAARIVETRHSIGLAMLPIGMVASNAVLFDLRTYSHLYEALSPRPIRLSRPMSDFCCLSSNVHHLQQHFIFFINLQSVPVLAICHAFYSRQHVYRHC